MKLLCLAAVVLAIVSAAALVPLAPSGPTYTKGMHLPPCPFPVPSPGSAVVADPPNKCEFVYYPNGIWYDTDKDDSTPNVQIWPDGSWEYAGN